MDFGSPLYKGNNKKVVYYSLKSGYTLISKNYRPIDISQSSIVLERWSEDGVISLGETSCDCQYVEHVRFMD